MLSLELSFVMGCSSVDPDVRFLARSDLLFVEGESDTPFLPGRMGVVPFTDQRSLPFHGQSSDDEGVFFISPMIRDFQDALVGTLVSGKVCQEALALDDGSEPLLEPSPEVLRDFGLRHPDLDFVLSGEVDVLNITTRFMGKSNVSVGNLEYNDVSFFGHRLRIRAQLEIYSLAYNKLVWGDVIEGVALEAEYLKAVQELVTKAFHRFTAELHSSLTRSATKVKKWGASGFEFESPSWESLVAASADRGELRRSSLVEDVKKLRTTGPKSAEHTAKREHARKIKSAEANKAFAQLINAAVAQNSENSEEAEPAIDVEMFDKAIEKLGSADGSTILGSNRESLKAELVEYDPTIEVKPAARVSLLGANFLHHRAPSIDVLSQLGDPATRQLGAMAERTLDAYRREYEDRPGLAARLSDQENRLILLVFANKEAFSLWTDQFGGPSYSGGYWLYADDTHVVRKALANQDPFQKQRGVIAIFWSGYTDEDGGLLAGIDAMWSTVPHEIGHHVHYLMLGGDPPDFQFDGFTMFHEYPVDFAGSIRFGQFQTPTNAGYAYYLAHEPLGAIPLPEIIEMDYDELSNGGLNNRGYASMWLYYQFLRRNYPGELKEFELEIAALQPERDEIRSLFMARFELADEEELEKFSLAATEWISRQDVSLKELGHGAQARRAVQDGVSVFFSNRRRSLSQSPH